MDELAAWTLRKDRQPMHRVDDQPPWSCTPDRTLSNRRAESVRIVPRQMPLLIRIANSGAPCSDNQVDRDPPHPRVGHQRSAQGSAEPARPISACRAWHSWAASALVTTSSRPSDGSPFADRPHDSNAGRAAIFPGVVSGRSFLLWPWRRGAASRGGSRRLTPASGAWLFQYPLVGSISSSARETVRYFSVSPKGCTTSRQPLCDATASADFQKQRRKYR